MTEIPPPRYRVVERGRRLEVIDTRTGAPVKPHDATTPTMAKGAEAGETLVRWLSRGETAPDGRPVLRTHAAYDLRGPRRIALEPGRVLVAVAGSFALIALGIAAATMLAGFGGLVVAGIGIGIVVQHGRPLFTRVLGAIGETIET